MGKGLGFKEEGHVVVVVIPSSHMMWTPLPSPPPLQTPSKQQ
jgi:hypothetical protein